MAALGAFRPGSYTATYNSVALGLTTGDGWKLRWKPSKIKIQNTNAYGDTLIDGIFRGMTGVQLMTTLKEWNAAVQAALWPYSNATPAFDGVLGVMGQLDTGVAKSLVLTADTSSPAFLTPGKTVTAAGAILAAENDYELLMGPIETDMPIVFDLLLYDSSGTKRFFAIT